jgi:hypothetical protein
VNTTNQTGREANVVTELYVKKFTDRQIVTVNAPVTVSVLVNNFAAKLFDFTVTDQLPPGFQFVSGEGWKQQGQNLVYTGKVSSKNVVIPSYLAVLNDSDSAGLDYFPASVVTYVSDGSGKTVYSDTVPFIRQYLPNQRIFVQKKLSYQANDEVLVTLTVQNLGSTTLRDLLLKDYLEDADVFSQISQQPDEKGLWTIKELKANEVWEVSYLTTTDTKLTILPGLYGVASSDVLKSLVLEAVVSSGWEAAKKAAVEIVGIGLLFGLPILYFVLRKRPPRGNSSSAPALEEGSAPAPGNAEQPPPPA